MVVTVSKSLQHWHQFLHLCQGLFTWRWNSEGPWKSFVSTSASLFPGSAVEKHTMISQRGWGPLSQCWPCSCPHNTMTKLCPPSPLPDSPYLAWPQPAALLCRLSVLHWPLRHTLAFQEGPEVAVCQISSRHACIYNGRGCASPSLPPHNPVIVHSGWWGGQWLHSFGWSFEAVAGQQQKERSFLALMFLRRI